MFGCIDFRTICACHVNTYLSSLELDSILLSFDLLEEVFHLLVEGFRVYDVTSDYLDSVLTLQNDPHRRRKNPKWFCQNYKVLVRPNVSSLPSGCFLNNSINRPQTNCFDYRSTSHNGQKGSVEIRRTPAEISL